MENIICLNQICDIQWESIAIESRGKNIPINKIVKDCYGNSKWVSHKAGTTDKRC